MGFGAGLVFGMRRRFGGDPLTPGPCGSAELHVEPPGLSPHSERTTELRQETKNTKKDQFKKMIK